MITLICGIPNAGKTTYSKNFKSVLHLDDIKHSKSRYKSIIELASQSTGDICIEGVYSKAKQRTELLEACKDNSPKICIWINTPLEECLEREKNYRKRSLGMVKRFHERFEEPTLEEGWDEIIIIS